MYDISRDKSPLPLWTWERRHTVCLQCTVMEQAQGRHCHSNRKRLEEERRTWPKQVQKLARQLFGWKSCHPCPLECQYHLHSSARALPTQLSARSASLLRHWARSFWPCRKPELWPTLWNWGRGNNPAHWASAGRGSSDDLWIALEILFTFLEE